MNTPPGFISTFFQNRALPRDNMAALRGYHHPQPASYHVTGILGHGMDTRYAVDGEDIVVNDATWVFGDLEIGAMARVSLQQRGSWKSATKILMKST